MQAQPMSRPYIDRTPVPHTPEFWTAFRAWSDYMAKRVIEAPTRAAPPDLAVRNAQSSPVPAVPGRVVRRRVVAPRGRRAR